MWIAPTLAEEGLVHHVEARAEDVRAADGGGHEHRSEAAFAREVAGRLVEAQLRPNVRARAVARMTR